MPPLAIKGEACTEAREEVDRRQQQAHLDLAQAYKFIQAQYITQWSRVLRSSGLNHSKLLCDLVFFPFSN
jgi:hypothetical protein